MDISSIVKDLQDLTRQPPQDASSRQRLYEAAREAMRATESTHDLMNRVMYSQILITIVKAASDLGIFRVLTTSPKCTTQELARETQADELLTSRIVRGLLVHGLVDTSDGSYSANHATRYLAEDLTADAIDHNQITVGRCLEELPEFIINNGRRNIEDKTTLPFHAAFNTKLNPFQWFPSHPKLMKAMIGTMASARAGQPIWFADPKCFPLEDFTLSSRDLDNKRVLLVDVGGGGGQQCVNFRNSHPTLPGRVILEDEPPILESLPKDHLLALNIETQGIDFFVSQPVQGAKVYYLRTVIHDWPDKDCNIILGHIRRAMAPDSVLALDEIVMDEEKPNWKQVNVDIIMMSALAGMERTLSQFSGLLAANGLKIRDVKRYDDTSGESVLFAVAA